MINDKMVILLAYVTGLVNQKLLLQNEYLVAENRILRSHLPKRLPLTDPQRSPLAEIGKRLGRKALSEVTVIVKPETILAWQGEAFRARGFEDRSKGGAELGVAIVQDVPLIPQMTTNSVFAINFATFSIQQTVAIPDDIDPYTFPGAISTAGPKFYSIWEVRL
jgi:hypothetical protein